MLASEYLKQRGLQDSRSNNLETVKQVWETTSNPDLLLSLYLRRRNYNRAAPINVRLGCVAVGIGLIESLIDDLPHKDAWIKQLRHGVKLLKSWHAEYVVKCAAARTKKIKISRINEQIHADIKTAKIFPSLKLAKTKSCDEGGLAAVLRRDAQRGSVHLAAYLANDVSVRIEWVIGCLSTDMVITYLNAAITLYLHSKYSYVTVPENARKVAQARAAKYACDLIRKHIPMLPSLKAAIASSEAVGVVP